MQRDLITKYTLIGNKSSLIKNLLTIREKKNGNNLSIII